MNFTTSVGWVTALVLSACAARSGTPTPGGDTPGDTPGGDTPVGDTPSKGLPTDPNCPAVAPGPDARCMQECGPPVAREGDPPPPYRWFTADDAKNRESFGCPRCLDGSTAIATPRGEVRVDELSVGDIVWTESIDGARIEAPIVRTSRVPVPSSHRLVALTLADGRELRVSAGHPLALDGAIGDLAVGAMLEGAPVVSREEVAPERAFTFDILPAGATGRYWAGGVRLGSTLHRKDF